MAPGQEVAFLPTTPDFPELQPQPLDLPHPPHLPQIFLHASPHPYLPADPSSASSLHSGFPCVSGEGLQPLTQLGLPLYVGLADLGLGVWGSGWAGLVTLGLGERLELGCTGLGSAGASGSLPTSVFCDGSQ